VTLDEIFAVCRSRTPTKAEVESYCAAATLDTEGGLNAIALEVARRYLAGDMDFGDGDSVANSLHGWSMTHRDSMLPEPANGIFLAFDEGEYRHQGDSESVDNEAKYTRPMIIEVLRGIDAV
jgi:hypothetical protein